MYWVYRYIYYGIVHRIAGSIGTLENGPSKIAADTEEKDGLIGKIVRGLFFSFFLRLQYS